MSLQIECSTCDYKGTVPESAVGTTMPCPKCHTLLMPLTHEKMENFAAKVLFAAPTKQEEVVREEPAGPETEFVCPFCGEAYPVSKDLAGKKITCRNCREASLVDAPRPKRRRRDKSRYSWQWIWLCFTLCFFSLLLGLLIGKFFR